MGHKLQINQNNIDQWQTDEDKITIIKKEDDINQIRKFKKEAIYFRILSNRVSRRISRRISRIL